MRDLIWTWRLRHPSFAGFASKVAAGIVPAIAASAVAALVLTHLGVPAAGPGARAAQAGPDITRLVDMAQLVKDEHELIADALRRDRARERDVIRMADAEWSAAAQSVAAARDTAKAAQFAAAAAHNPERDRGISGALAKSPRADRRQVASAGNSTSASKPLRLPVMTDPPMAAAPAVVGTKTNPVRGKLWQFASAIDDVPVWFRDAAHWVGALPGRILPDRGSTAATERRRFSASI